MRKRKFLLEYKCKKLSVNILARISSCDEHDYGNKCSGCPHKEDIDHSNRLRIGNLIVEGNDMIAKGENREEVAKKLKLKYSLDGTQLGKVKRGLNYVFLSSRRG